MSGEDETTGAPVDGPETPGCTQTPTDPAQAASGAPGADSGPVEDESGTADGAEDGDGAEEDERDEDRDDDRGHREAARRRRELRETRTERDRLAGVVERFQRRDVEAFVAELLVDPADVWRDGLDLGDVLDGDGLVDSGKLAAVVDGIVAAHPHWAPQRPGYLRLGGGGRGASPSQEGTGTRALGDALTAAVGRGRRPL